MLSKMPSLKKNLNFVKSPFVQICCLILYGGNYEQKFLAYHYRTA